MRKSEQIRRISALFFNANFTNPLFRRNFTVKKNVNRRKLADVNFFLGEVYCDQFSRLFESHSISDATFGINHIFSSGTHVACGHSHGCAGAMALD